MPRRGGLERRPADHLRGGARRARGHQGLGAGHRLGAGRRAGVAGAGAQHPLRVVQPVRRGDRRRLDRLPRARHPPQAPRRGLPGRAQLLRGRDRGRGVRPGASHRGGRPLDRDRRTRSPTPTRRSGCGTPRSTTRRPRSRRTSATPTRTPRWWRSTCDARCSSRREHHLDWITVRGFELAQAACPWTPPTADQPGLIGPNWAKGWIIEDNVIHDAKCSAVSLGKEASTGHNCSTQRLDKPGYQYQLESVFSARQIGWDAEHIGSHVVRRNHIYDCGQNGVVGHLGLRVLDDRGQPHPPHRRPSGSSTATRSAASSCTPPSTSTSGTTTSTTARSAPGSTGRRRAPGSRATSSPRNSRDLFVEVSHGPYVVDHNVLRLPRLDRAVQPGRRVRRQRALRLAPPGEGDGPRHAVPPPAQHPGRRLRRDLRRGRPLGRQPLPRRPGRGGVRVGGRVLPASPATAPPCTTGTRRASPTTSP